jgi:23S rRNA (cytosine1962-C5)-methyltransferase
MEADSFAVDRDWPRLVGLATRWLSDGGWLYFSTNSRQLKWDDALVPEGFQAREISARTVPDDFRNRRIHRCWTVSRVSGPRPG